MKIHLGQKDTVIINYPGMMGTEDGFNDKHKKIAESLTDLGTVIRMCNYGEYLTDALENTIQVAMDYFQAQNIYLMGTSAGASAICEVAHKYPLVKKILLVCPSGNCHYENISRFNGDVAILAGDEDNVVGPLPKMIHTLLYGSNASIKYCSLPGANHHLEGELNGKYLSVAPRWAFQNKPLDPNDGFILY